jgi:hypothetical protein
MSPFKAFYGRKCNTPVSWDNLVDKSIIGLDLLKELEEKMTRIRKNLKASQGRQKSYVEKKHIF